MKFSTQNKIQLCVYFAKTNLQQTYQSELTNHNLRDQFIFSKRNSGDIPERREFQKVPLTYQIPF